MKTKDLISLSTRMFRTRPMRTFLTILGVSVGIGSVLFLVSLGYGLQRIILNQITNADALLSLDVSPSSAELVMLDQGHITTIAQTEHVIEISRLKNVSGQVNYNELTGDAVIYAIDPAYFRLADVRVDHGRLFDSSAASNSIIISTAMATLFNMSEDEMLGKKVQLTLFVPKRTDEDTEEIEVIPQPEEFEVIGVVRDENTSFAYVALTGLSSSGFTSYDLLKVKVSPETELENVREQIINAGFIVSSLSDVIEQANKIFRVIQIVLGLFGLVALIVSAIGMFNTMTIALLERINEIGIMRSIGITSRDIRLLFLLESTIMGTLGGFGGIVLGFLVGELANFGINILARTFGGKPLDLFYQPVWFLLVILTLSTIIGVLTGLFPSRKAANMDPLEALRYK